MLIWRQQREHFQERKWPKGHMPERHLQESQISKGLLGEKIARGMHALKYEKV